MVRVVIAVLVALSGCCLLWVMLARDEAPNGLQTPPAASEEAPVESSAAAPPDPSVSREVTTPPPVEAIKPTGPVEIPKKAVDQAGGDDSAAVRYNDLSAPGEVYAPESFAEWDSLAFKGQMDAVAGYLNNDRVPDAVLRYFRILITNSGYDPVVRNELANVLSGQRIKDRSLAGMFADMYMSNGESSEWQDFALQFAAKNLPHAVQADRERVEGVLWKAVSDGKDIHAGTALLNLSELVEQEALDHREELSESVGAILKNGRSPGARRLTAVGVIGRLGLVEHVPQLQSLLLDPQAVVMERRAALAALGHIGDASMAPWLEAFAATAGPQLMPAVNAAINRVQTRK